MNVFTILKEQVNKSIFIRLFLFFLAIIFFPIVIFSAFSYDRLTSLIKETYDKDNMQILNSLSENLETYLDEYSRITFNAFLSNAIQSILKNDEDDDIQRLQNQWLFDDYTVTIYSDRSYLESIYLVTNSGYVYSRYPSYSTKLMLEVLEKEWFKMIREGNGSFVVAISYERIGVNPYGRYLIHVGRQILDLNTNRPLGVFFINLNYSWFANFFSRFDTEDKRKMIIHDQDGLIVYDRNENNITQAIDSVYPELRKNVNGKEFIFQNEKVYILTMPGKKNNWTYIEIVQIESLYKKINNIILSILWTALGCYAAYLIVAFLISRKIINPWVYETRLKELDLKLKALQSQINPHFLYNTLESINCLAQIKNENEISEMIRDLARMFRYTGSGGTDATLEDEVTHVKDYIFLQAFRYEDKFSMEYNIPDELLKVKAVKLMLQPLVENAIHHGIEKIPGKGHIRINANLDGRSVIIEVRDNGIGIEKEKLVEINKKLDSTLTDLSILDERQSSIGIYNIHLRIKLLCGAVYGIRLVSVSGGGTSVIIRLPVA